VGSAACYVCNRGWDTLDELSAHLIEHPGRTVEEMARGKEALARLKGAPKKRLEREAEHNDHVEVFTDIPGVAINEARAKEDNRAKLVAVGAKKLADPDGPEPYIDTGLVPDTGVLSREEWEKRDAPAQAQRQPYPQMAENFAARHLYDAREIPWNEHIGNTLSVKAAKINDQAEAAVAEEVEREMDVLDERDKALEKAGFDPTHPDTPESRRRFADYKANLVEERRKESAAVFAEQFPEEAKKQGVKAEKVPSHVRAAVAAQKRDAARARAVAGSKAARATGLAVSPEPVLSQVNEPVVAGQVAPPTEDEAATRRREQATKASAAAARKRRADREAREREGSGAQE
jgi:hypothetical protein